jgi:hypothetical protein
MKYTAVWVGLMIFMLLNCQKQMDKNSGSPTDHHSENRYLKEQRIDPGSINNKAEPCNSCVFTEKFLNMDNVLINGNVMILSENDFHKFYPQKDSVRSEVWDCGSPFEWLDKTWMERTYGKDLSSFDGRITTFYAQHAEFISNGHNIIFNNAKAANNRFEIRSPHMILSEKTTVAEFQKLFPDISMDKDMQNKTVVFRIPLSKDTEDSFEFYFAEGRLERFNVWWLLC